MKYACDCGIREADHWKEKSYRLSAEMNYQYRFYWVPCCWLGHEMEELCEECGERERTDDNLCRECWAEQVQAEAEYAYDAKMETRRDQNHEIPILLRSQK